MKNIKDMLSGYSTQRVYADMFAHLGESEFPASDINWLSDDLKNYAECLIEDTGQGVAFDYAMAFINDVDWYQIANVMLDKRQSV